MTLLSGSESKAEGALFQLFPKEYQSSVSVCVCGNQIHTAVKAHTDQHPEESHPVKGHKDKSPVC